MERDGELARGTVELDHAVNQDEIDLDALCLQLLACRQPMASDLRFVTITMKMVTDLERIADLAVNVAERAADLSAQPELSRFVDIPKMGDCVRTMIRDSIVAYWSPPYTKMNKCSWWLSSTGSTLFGGGRLKDREGRDSAGASSSR